MESDLYSKFPERNFQVQDKDKDPIYPLGTVVRLKKTGEFALITDISYLKDGSFYHYLGRIEGRREGNYALFHDNIELECP